MSTEPIQAAAGNIVEFIDADAIRFPHRFYLLNERGVVLASKVELAGSSRGQVLRLSAPAGLNYTLEASIDLKTWTSLGAATSANGIIEVSVTHLNDPRQRFFRLTPR